MIAGIIFAHYIYILSEKYCYLMDWYVFGIPLAKRMATSNDDFKEENPAFNKPYEGGIGDYFISCKNCQHPISNYMLNETNVIHITPHQMQEWDEEEVEKLNE